MEGVRAKAQKVIVCTPTVTQPYEAWVSSMRAAKPVVEAVGYEFATIIEAGNPYISAARATMLRRALDEGADLVVFIDHDLSWAPQDLVNLIQSEGDIVAGLYRFKKPDVEFMGELVRPLVDGVHRPMPRADGCIAASRVSAGFLKVTRAAVERFMRAYPGLCYGSPLAPHVDLFNHGAHEGVWWGEDYAFSRNWLACGGEIWVVPDLNLTHHGADGTEYPGNLHEWLMRQPGGSKEGQA